MEKINKEYLDKINNLKNIESYFGNWQNNLENLKNEFVNNKPFSNIIIPNFLNLDYINKIENVFINDYNNWYKYDNPLEKKLAYDNINNLEKPLKDIFYLLSSDIMIKKLRILTGINDLEYDEFLHGAGLHAHPRGGKLAIHLDYEKHPISGKERRINIILYVSKNWKEEWNGHTELWNKDISKCVIKSPVIYNSAFIFKTNDISWHGLPEEIKCPEGVYRKSIAYYYVSSLTSKPNKNKKGSLEDGYRLKASYTLRPQDQRNENILKLIEIRNRRRITEKDLLNFNK